MSRFDELVGGVDDPVERERLRRVHELLLAVDRAFFGEEPPLPDAFAALEAFEPYLAARLAEGVRLHVMTRHLLGVFAGRPGARAFRRHLATEGVKPGAGLDTVRAAVAHVARDPLALPNAA